MTEIQKTQIKQMRANGIGYLKIAKTLGMSENTVKSYCRRAEREKHEPSHFCCEQCGKSIDLSKIAAKRFCSDTCRMRWWNTHPKDNGKYTAECLNCGQEIRMRRKGERKYCSHSCYIAYRYSGGVQHG